MIPDNGSCDTAAALRFSQNLHNLIKIFAGLLKLLPVFLLGTEHFVGGGRFVVKFVVVVNMCGKICGIDPMIMIVVCSKICGKICGEIKKLSDWRKKWCGSRY